MASERDRKIRDRAHQIWEESGRPDGKAEEHWAQALAEIDGQGSTGSGRTAPKSGKPAASGSVSKAKSAVSSGSGGEGAKKPAAAKTSPAKAQAKEAAPKSGGKSASAAKGASGAAPSASKTAKKKA
jgi:hypothetical protein